MSIVNNKKMNKQKLREFKLCVKCNKELKWDKFRERKDLGWKDINNKLRYTYCKKCETDVANIKYRKNPIPQIFFNLIKRAKMKGLPFDLTIHDIKKKLNLAGYKCPVLGVDFRISEVGSKNNDLAPSIDRINPKKGYVRDNIIVVSMKANRIKSDATFDEIRKVANFYEKLSRKNC